MIFTLRIPTRYTNTYVRCGHCGEIRKGFALFWCRQSEGMEGVDTVCPCEVERIADALDKNRKATCAGVSS